MIERLTASNFRRFEEIDLSFEGDAQLILIDGSNGAGKTTILEAIHFALWGEGRSGRRRLDMLVRRGGELEGMQVELVFTVGEERYRINRRRDGGTATAVLYCNEEPLVEGVNEVTAEVANILGMDSAGFKLAVTAQQGDLEGLVSLRPAERSRMIGRLLRLDAIAAARAAAAELSRKERSLAQAKYPGSVSELEEALAAARESVDGAKEELSGALEAVDSLESQLAEVEPDSVAYKQAKERLSRLSGIADAAEAHLGRARKQAESLGEMEEIEDLTLERAALISEHKDAQARLARVEAEVERARHRRSLLKDISEIDESVEALSRDLKEPEAPDTDISGLEKELAEAETKLEEARDRLSRALGDQEILTEHAELEETCPTCLQEVSEKLREEHRKRSISAAAKAEESVSAARSAYESAASAVRAHRDELSAAREARSEHALAMRAWEEGMRRISELTRRRATYMSRVEQLPEEEVDPAPLKMRVDELEADLEEMERRVHAAAGAAQRNSSRDEAQKAVLRAEHALKEALSDLESSRPSPEALAAGERYESLLGLIKEEERIVSHWRTEVAVLEERMRNSERSLADATKRMTDSTEHQRAAESAAGASRILNEARTRLSASIRPELEGSVSAMLGRMSDGRFTRVSISEDYEVGVLDDDEYREMSELSGGEQDLVALSLRLGLSQMFTSRTGGGGTGFLILDECFGSQDPQRRRSILEALRELREDYSQIFVISHVEGLEDAADAVVHVSRYDDEPSEARQ